MLYEAVNEAHNDSRFLSFILTLVRRFDDVKVTDSYMDVDNCAIHNISGVDELFKDCIHNLVFLPLYFSQLNPIEETIYIRSLLEDQH